MKSSWQINKKEICQYGKYVVDKTCQKIDYWNMTLKELRKVNKLTQKEAALLINIPYRTYVRYEENGASKDSFKYQMLLKVLEEKTRIDEEHGIVSIDNIKELLIPILKTKKISYCYLFGSYARGSQKENSDIDFLVDTDITGLDFLMLVEEIRNTLHKKIDLLRLKDLKSDNPIILEILKDGIRLL